MALEGIGTGAGFIGPAAEDAGPGGLDGPADVDGPGLRFRWRTGPAMMVIKPAPIFTGSDLKDAVFLVEVAAGEFVGLHDLDDPLDADDFLDEGDDVRFFLADGPDDCAEFALGNMRSEAQFADAGGDGIDRRRHQRRI